MYDEKMTRHNNRATEGAPRDRKRTKRAKDETLRRKRERMAKRSAVR